VTQNEKNHGCSEDSYNPFLGKKVRRLIGRCWLLPVTVGTPFLAGWVLANSICRQKKHRFQEKAGE
jgi:hypothetical protein